MTLQRDFERFVRDRRLVNPSDRIIAAVSGGVDSMVLLHLLADLRTSIPVGLAVAHVNHGLRGADSDGDEEFVRGAAAALGVPCHVHRAPPMQIVPSEEGSGHIPDLQERAREERYRFLDSLFSLSVGTKAATAHHRDDNAETVLMNFLRGSGIRGLAGIPVSRSDGAIVRPLLFATREAIEEFAQARGIAHRADSTNARPVYARNVIRLTVLPAIRAAVNPGVRETLVRASELFSGLDEYLRSEVRRILPGLVTGEAPGEVRLEASKLAPLPGFLRDSLLQEVCRRFVPRGLGFAQARTLSALTEARAGAQCLIRKNLHAAREGGALVLRAGPPDDCPFDVPVRKGESYELEGFSFRTEAAAPGEAHVGPRPEPDEQAGPDRPERPSCIEECVDDDLLGDLRLRSWIDGDWFVPLGLGGRKKIGDYFTDRKIPADRRRRIPILLSGDAVVWICGERLDERFRITPSTRRVLRLTYRRTPR